MNRSSVLAKVRRVVGDSAAEDRVRQTLVFCFRDGEPIEADLSRARYYHGDHVSDRAYIFLPESRWEFTESGELRHESAAALVWRELDGERRYCLFRRRTHPIGFYTVPAGHLDQGEQPGPAALREVFEETQLGIIQSESFGQPILFHEECRRGSDEHIWDVLHCQAVGEPRLSDEGDVIGWYGREEILRDLQLTNPTGALFETLFGETPQHVRAR